MAQPPIRPLGRVLTSIQAALYDDAVAARQMVERDGQHLRKKLQDEAANDREATRQGLTNEATTESIRAETAFATRATQELAKLEGAIASAIFIGVERVVGGFGLDEAVARAARIALQALQERVGITIRVAPSRLDAVRSGLEPIPDGVTISPDAALGEADCVVATPGGFVRVGLDHQLDVLRKAITRPGRP